ncbi:MAG TPA: PAS domain-containing protein, partial [Magnetospirillum sp.]|nr:PAS domain-containing protein [Magnetospirillum sp.]
MPDVFRDAFAALTAPCAIADGSGRLAQVNDAFAGLAGRGAAALIGQMAGEVLEGLPADLDRVHPDLTVQLRVNEYATLRVGCSSAPLPAGGAVLTLRPASELAAWPYQAVVEAVPEGITIRAADGRIIGINSAARTLLGPAGSPELIHWNGEPLAPSDHPAHLAQASGNPVSAIIGTRQPDGTVRWLQVHSVPIHHPEAGDAVVSSFTEINQLVEAQKRLADSERRFRAIFDQTFEFIGLLTTDGRMIEANATALAFIGAELRDVAGQHFADT